MLTTGSQQKEEPPPSPPRRQSTPNQPSPHAVSPALNAEAQGARPLRLPCSHPPESISLTTHTGAGMGGAKAPCCGPRSLLSVGSGAGQYWAPQTLACPMLRTPWSLWGAVGRAECQGWVWKLGLGALLKPYGSSCPCLAVPPVTDQSPPTPLLAVESTPQEFAVPLPSCYDTSSFLPVLLRGERGAATPALLALEAPGWGVVQLA